MAAFILRANTVFETVMLVSPQLTEGVERLHGAKDQCVRLVAEAESPEQTLIAAALDGLVNQLLTLVEYRGYGRN